MRFLLALALIALATSLARAEKLVVLDLKSVRVTFSEPRLVAESQDFLWFPTLVKHGDSLLAIMDNLSDTTHTTVTALGAWSDDRGKTWTTPKQMPWCDGAFKLPDGTLQLLPFTVRADPMQEGVYRCDRLTLAPKAREVAIESNAVTIRGFPKKLAADEKKTGVPNVRFNGDTVPLRDGGFLTTAYGQLDGDPKRRTMVLASPDGRTWTYRATISADADLSPSKEGCNESSICRLRDGRLMCVFRRSAYATYGQAWSSDEGVTWTKPQIMKSAHSVQPNLVALADGTLLLSGGRPGIYAWLDLTGKGEDWQEVNLHAHHNSFHPDRAIPVIEVQKSSRDLRTSSYTQMVPLDDKRVLLIYDYVPNGWAAIPADSPLRNQVWCVELTLDRDAAKRGEK